MSTKKPTRLAVLDQLSQAGRESSNVAVVFHTAISRQMDLGVAEEKALDLLDREGSLTAGELTARMGLAPASITGVLNRLDAKGYISRTRDADDGRRVVVKVRAETVASFLPLFSELVENLDTLHARYTRDELVLILDYVQRATAVQREAAVRLNELPPPAS